MRWNSPCFLGIFPITFWWSIPADLLAWANFSDLPSHAAGWVGIPWNRRGASLKIAGVPNCSSRSLVRKTQLDERWKWMMDSLHCFFAMFQGTLALSFICGSSFPSETRMVDNGCQHAIVTASMEASETTVLCVLLFYLIKPVAG